MLRLLSIQNIVLIDTLRVDFASGLCVLTGETGAGKSILLDSLGLALGARADPALVRNGAHQGSVTAEFDVPLDHPAYHILQQQALEIEPPLLLRRQIKSEGGSRAFINDHPVSVATLRAVGESLVEIHGQHDDRGLLNPSGHRDLLDAFGLLTQNAQDVRTCWQHWFSARQALEAAQATHTALRADQDFLRHALEELERFAPQKDEDQQLAQRRHAIMMGEKILDDIEASASLLNGRDGALALLRSSARKLERMSDEMVSLAQALSAIDTALDHASTAAAVLDEVQRTVSVDAREQDAIEARLFDLRALARKHKVAPEALADFVDSLREKLRTIEGDATHLAQLNASVDQARRAYQSASAQLTKARHAAATALDQAVARELVPLKLDKARFKTVITPLEESAWGPYGCEQVHYEISTNPNAPFGPLARIASGGELSRFLLAIKSALAAEGSATTVVFDEIDRGVGGAVAAAIGERLVHLSQTAQVMVVTHAPQVAARGQHHFLIEKKTTARIATTNVRLLNGEQRVQEVARMLSDDHITPEARAQAKNLLAGRVIHG